MNNEVEIAREEFINVYKEYVYMQKGEWTEADEAQLNKEMKNIEKAAWIEAVAISVIGCAVIASAFAILVCVTLKFWF